MNKILVPPDGRKDALIAGVGQAPGKEELRQGRPFAPSQRVKNAAIVLEEILRLVGLCRSDIYLTNVLKEHPSVGPELVDSDIKNWINYNYRTRRISTSGAFDEYVSQLKEELRGISANVIVTFGNEAMYALTGKWGITKWRGSILEWEGRKVIPTIHPAATIHKAREEGGGGKYMYFHMIHADFRRIKYQSTFPDIILPQRKFIIAPSFLEFKTFIEGLLTPPKIKKLAVDIEVVNEEMSNISFAPTPDFAFGVPFVERGMQYWNPEDEYEVMKLIAQIMEDSEIIKCGHFINFDTSFMFSRYGIRSVNLCDTAVRISVVFPDFPKGLGFSTSLYTEEPYYKDDGKKWKGFGDETAFRIYNCKDSAIDIEIEGRLEAETIKQGNVKAFKVQNALIEPLMYMQARGIRIDISGLQKASEKAEEEIGILTEELSTIIGFPLNPNSPDQVAKYFYETKGCKPFYFKGAITTNVNAMKRLAVGTQSRPPYKEADLILKIRKLRKLKGTYLDVKLSSDGRLRSAMSPITKNGRLSSSEDIFGEGTNVQNLPDAMKQFTIADEDFILYNADISQGENRVNSHIAPEPTMIKAYQEDKDMHILTASLVFSIPYDQVSDEPGSSPLGNGEQSERFWGKKLNFSLWYGMGYGKFALDFELPEHEAKLLHNRWHQVYPGVRQFWEWVRMQLSKDRTLTNPYGRKRLFLDQWGDELFKAAYDYIAQSTVACKINEQGLEYIWYSDRRQHIDLLNQVHDSIVFQIPKALPWMKHAELLLDLVRSLETPVKWRSTEFVLPLDLSTGMNLSKKALKGVKVHGKTVEGLARQLHDLYPEQRAEGEL